ncbi:hypothetical protein BDW74DRAFT_86587 [Aspergillus multicolor]|uniref:uncharacterized protein n=1 Tax=Aspergillus multicolor TaxID=41759 RepID=UPI003CCE177E
MDEVRIAVLSEFPTNLLATFHRDLLVRAETAHAIVSTAGEHTRLCTVDEEDCFVVTREKRFGELEKLHCFEHYSPPDGIIFVYDATSSYSFQSVLTALEKVVDMDWGPRLPSLGFSRRTASNVDGGPGSHKERENGASKRLLCPLLCVVGDTLLSGPLDRDLDGIPEEEKRVLAERFRCEAHEVSTENGEDVDEIVKGLVRAVIKRERDRVQAPAVAKTAHRGSSLRSIMGSLSGKLSAVLRTKQ